MKKGLLFLTAVAMLVMLLTGGQTVNAAGIPQFEVSSAQGAPGEMITVTVSLNHNPGFGGLAFDVYYDAHALRLESYELDLGSNICTDSGMDTYPDHMNFQYGGTSNVEGDGVLVELVFEIIADTSCTAEIRVIPEEGTSFRYDGRKEVDFSLEEARGEVRVDASCSHQNKTAVPAREATCETPGNALYYHCGECGLTLKADGVTETTPEAEVIPALGHSFTHYISNGDAKCTEDGTKTAKCDRCDATDTVPDPGSAGGHLYSATVTKPTCTQKGYTTYTCSECGHSYKDNIVPASGHNYTKAVTAPTCTQQGYTTYTCTSCDHSYVGDYVSAKGHEYDSVVTPPTCTQKGYTTHTCRCGEGYTDTYVDALGHAWDEGTVTTEPTEETEGEMTYHCTRCEETKTQPIPVKDHTHSYDAVVTPPTCTGKGYTTHTCRCGEGYTDTYVDALGHAWDEGTVTTEPTEETEGEMTYHCTRCEETKTQPIPVKDHTHSYDAVVTAPTCTQKGYTTHTCRCGEGYTDTYVDALGHAWDEGTVTTEPTEETEGEMTYHCIRCEETKTQPIPVKDHTHNYGEWEIWTQPTGTENGEVRRYCACGAYESDVIPALENPFVDVSRGSYCYESVLWAAYRGITSGTSATHFSPNQCCTRGQVVTFLWRAMGKPEPTITENPFSDVGEDAFYYKAVLWALENGITSGTSATRFSPNAVCTRGQVVTFLWRAMGQPQAQSGDHPFRDVQENAYYYQAMLWAVENGVTSGYGATTFAPNNACTRGQVVTFLYRALGK